MNGIVSTLLISLIASLVQSPRYQLSCYGFSISSLSRFHGEQLHVANQYVRYGRPSSSVAVEISMRKQKASDRRTRRMQRRGEDLTQKRIRESLSQQEVTITSSPMTKKGVWMLRRQENLMDDQIKAGGRGRSRKRSLLYKSLSLYHNTFLNFLTAEYTTEEQEVIERIKSSIEDPLSLELAGHALLDMYPERRGSIFSDEIYRLVKSKDATTNIENNKRQQNLPPNNKFSKNDVILLTLQPLGCGDFFDPRHLPISKSATRVEARVINRGPTYIDVAVNAGVFEATFGPAPNNVGLSGKGDSNLCLRADRFFSSTPYERMVEAVTRMSTIPENESQLSDGIEKEPKESSNDKKKKTGKNNKSNNSSDSPHNNIRMDDLLREVIISSYSFSDPTSPMFHDVDAVDLVSLERRLARPPMPSSIQLANQVLKYVQSNSGTGKAFKSLNAPQLAAIGAALTRKLTLIQGPPGTGKTTTASAIGFGFTYQCRSLSPNAKVLASSFSNAGADNLAEGFRLLGLKVIRIGKASAISESLWSYSLDAAIDRDPEAKKASDLAASATAQLMKVRKEKKKSNGATLSERAAQEIATSAVKRSIRASNIAATKALREADIIVSTCTGAADPRLMAACGLNIEPDFFHVGSARSSNSDQQDQWKTVKDSGNVKSTERTIAPDGLPPLSLPFVIIDEACQGVEPGTLIPITASNSCRSLVLIGDPCQLPATVKSNSGSSFSISLMERLAATLPAPKIKVRAENTELDNDFTDSLPVKQAKTFLRSQSQDNRKVSYRKHFAGCFLLNLQYRMHPSIAAFSSSIFYDGLLASPAFVASQRSFPSFLSEIMPCDNPSFCVRMINVGGRCNELKGGTGKNTERFYSSNAYPLQQDSSTTYRNEVEAVRVVSLIKGLLEYDHKNSSQDAKRIGVISPYNGQVHLIKSLLSDDKHIISLVRSTSATIEVNSVDGYQGRECDVVIFSTVRSNQHGNIGFLTDWRRLNVALTRAKSALLVIGDIDTLAEGDKYWGAFSKWCEGSRCLVDDKEDLKECNLL